MCNVTFHRIFFCSAWNVKDFSVPQSLYVIRMTPKIEHATGASTAKTGGHTFILRKTIRMLNATN